MNKIAILSISLLVFTGCARLEIYEDSRSDEVAKLIFPSPSKSKGILGYYSASVTLFTIADEKGCGRLYRSGDAQENSIEHLVPANRNLILSSSFRIGAKACNVTAYFKPEKDREYIAAPNISSDYCSLNVFDNTAKTSVPIKYAKLDTWTAKSACIK